MFYKELTICDCFDEKGNYILSIRKANVEGMQENLLPQEISYDEYRKEWEIDSIEKIYDVEGLPMQDYQLRDLSRMESTIWWKRDEEIF